MTFALPNRPRTLKLDRHINYIYSKNILFGLLLLLLFHGHTYTSAYASNIYTPFCNSVNGQKFCLVEAVPFGNYYHLAINTGAWFRWKLKYRYIILWLGRYGLNFLKLFFLYYQLLSDTGKRRSLKFENRIYFSYRSRYPQSKVASLFHWNLVPISTWCKVTARIRGKTFSYILLWNAIQYQKTSIWMLKLYLFYIPFMSFKTLSIWYWIQ